ncbi:MAG: sigma-70 family RNA polymerase sigma factor [Deltaproteobacteria bacterium]|nr:sigma-70 family RNA polymerase sigma factor [Deltaproteobacteria bacterium]
MAEDRLTDLYRRFGPLIFARCRRLLRDPALAEDATQEVFVRVYKHLDRAPSDDEALAWMYRISTNYCLDLMRRKSVRGEESEPDERMPAEDAPTDLRIEDRDLVMKLLGRTPEKLRAPALLYHVDGMEQEQIAKLLNVSRRTVINRLQEFAERAKKFMVREAPGGAA